MEVTRSSSERTPSRARELERTLAVLDALFESPSVGFAFFDRELRYARINDMLAAINGPPVMEHLGRTVQEVLGAAGEDLAAMLRRVLDTGMPLTGIEVAASPPSTPDEVRDFVASFFPVRASDGAILGVGAVVFEITQRKRAESRLRNAEAKARFLSVASAALASSLDYRETLQTVAHLAVPTLADWCVVDVVEDGAVKRVSVVHSDPTKVAMAQEFSARYPPDPHVDTGVMRVIRTGQPEMVADISDALLVQLSRDSDYLRMIRELGMRSYVSAPLRTRGRTLGAISFVSSESGRRYDQGDLDLLLELAARAATAIDNARLHEEAQQAVRMREQMLAVVSHDLKNPLGTVLISADSLLHGAIDAKAQTQVLRIQRAAQRMDHMIGDLLDMASLQAGRLTLERRPEDPETILREALDLHEPIARAKHIELRRDTRFGGVRAMCDRNRILQVLSNLLENALKFSESGACVTIRGGVVGTRVRISVSDNGAGIAAEELPHLFEPYWSGTRRARQGTGLGLYIARGIVQAHGSELTVDSSPGEGSTFTFTLPAAD